MIVNKVTMSQPLAPQSWSDKAGRTLRGALFKISEDETLVARRGFLVRDAAVGLELETIGAHFVRAYNEAVVASKLEPLVAFLEAIAPPYRGFAYEGAGMGLAVRDAVTPGGALWQAFVQGPARLHHYIVYVGRGWSFARLPGPFAWHARHLKGPLRWLTLDGFGFHEGFFHWARSIDAQKAPRLLRGYALRAFDQGLGRSLWFVRGADPTEIQAAIGRFEAARHSDLWAGIGLAATYAGGLPASGFAQLRRAAGIHLPSLAQGAVFAAEARHRAGIDTPSTALATRLLCDMDVSQAAALARRTKPDEDLADPDGLLYEAWRRDIRAQFT